jgi:hypothetical protein
MQNSKTNSANSASETPESEKPRQTPGGIVSRRRGFDRVTLRQIAQLCAKGLTQSESCRRLGYKPKSFINWQSRNRNNEKWAAILEDFRAERFDSLIQKIENCADGKGMKQPDWRAAAHLLMVSDKRFNPAQDAPTTVNNTNITVNALYIEAARRVYGEPALKPPSPTCKALLPAPTPDEANAGVIDFVDKLKSAGPLKP